MSIPIKGSITSWFKGMADDPRIQDFSYFYLSIHNDLFNAKRVTPFRSTQDNTTDGANEVIQRFLVANAKLYGLGQTSSGSAVTKIYEKVSDIIADGWQASANGADGSGVNDGRAFIAYKGLATTTFLYGLTGAGRIWAYDVAGSGGAFHATAMSLSYTNAAQPIVTGDDLLLFPYDNKIAVKDGGTTYNDSWESARLTLPADVVITDLEEHGQLVAITCKPLNANARNSIVYLWDKVSADVTESFDVGEGAAMISASLDGELVTLVNQGGASAAALTNKLILRKYLGGKTSTVIQEVPTEAAIVDTTNGPSSTKLKDQNRVSLVLATTLDGTARKNLWTIGRKKQGYPIMITMGMELNNNSQPTSVQGAAKVGGYHFFAVNSGTILRTNNGGAYSATSTYISQKFAGEIHSARIAMKIGQGVRRTKQLKWAGITCPPLPAGSTISLYYRTDGNTSWTKIFDYTTLNGLTYQQGVDSAGADFLNFNELQFKLTTTGGTSAPAEWSSIDYEFEILDALTED